MRLMLWLKAVAILATVGSSLPPTYGAVPDDVGASWVLPSSAKPILEKVMPKMAEALALGWCDARIQRDAVEFVLGPSTASKTARNQRAATHRVTAVHPSKASQQGLIGRYIALNLDRVRYRRRRCRLFSTSFNGRTYRLSGRR